MSWTNISKPGAQTYTTVGKPSNGFVIRAGTATGLIAPPTYATTHTIGNMYTNIAKPSTIDQQNLQVNSFDDFGGTSAIGQKLAQTFTPSLTRNLNSLQFAICKEGSPTDNVTLKIYTDGVTAPATLVATANPITSASLVNQPSDPANVPISTFYFSPAPLLTASQLYWAVLDRSGSLSNTDLYWLSVYSSSSTYTRGDLWYFNGSSWTNTTDTDAYFIEHINSFFNISKPT